MSNWPKHNNPKPEHAAKAPYNFVPLPERVVKVDPRRLPDQDAYHPGQHTGWLDCRLTTASPLYTRTALELEEFERSQDKEAEAKRPWEEQARNKPDFFHLDASGQPVIPGSSLRGMLRGLVEIAGYGKVQWVADRPLVYRAVGDTTSHGELYRDRLMHFDGVDQEDGKRYYMYTPLMQAGYMRRDYRGDWRIQPARQIGGVSFARIPEKAIPRGLPDWKGGQNASKIWVQTGPYDYQRVRGGFIRIKYARVRRAAAAPGPGLMLAVLARSGWMPNKRSEAVVFEPDEEARPIPVDDELVRRYQAQLADVYTEQAVRGGPKTSLLGPNGVLEDGHPVFYLIEDGKLVFFGHCMMFRVPYRCSPLDLVPAALRRETDTDLAEALFGYSKGGSDPEHWRDERIRPKERAYAGRVFVSDARLASGQPEDVWLSAKPIVPRILGGPKPTTFQHYLTQQQPNPVPTGGRFADGRPRTRMELSDYDSQGGERPVIRGHKRYWHKGRVGAGDIQEDEPEKKHDTQHTQIRPVRPGVSFDFRIRFENLLDMELGALLWVLDKAGDEAYRLNLGMGKPYGMGAVAVKAELHLTDRAARYGCLFADDDWAVGEKEAGLAPTNAKRLEDLERIQMLLAMLRWPGPDRDETRYLEIEREDPHAKRGKVNEYKDRPVLPDPLQVVPGEPVRPPSRPVPAAQADLPPGYRRGTVKKFGLGAKRSYGFITPDDGGKDVFVHQSNLAEGVETLEPDQRVIFRQRRGKRGPEAYDVEPEES
jgi:CRISPR-associated protein (TIGR03986 family)